MRGRSFVLAVALAALAGPAIALPATAPASPSSLPSAAPGAIRTLRVEDLEKQARERNPAIAAAHAALAALDAQMRNASSDPTRLQKLQETRAHLLAERQRMAVKFRTLVFHTLANQRRVESRERLAKLAHEATEVTDQLWNVGAADSPDRLAIENEARVLDSDLAAARFDLAEIRTVLKAAVGDPAMELGPLDGDLVAELPKIDPVEWRQRLLRESPSLQMVRDEIGQDEAALAEARRNAHGAAEAEAKLAEDRLRAEQIRITLEISFAETYAGYQSGVQQIATYRGGVLERAERAYEESLRQYRQMATAYPQVLIAQRTLYQVEDASLDALIKAWSAAIDIQALLPYELPQNLAPPIAAPQGTVEGQSKSGSY